MKIVNVHFNKSIAVFQSSNVWFLAVSYLPNTSLLDTKKIINYI